MLIIKQWYQQKKKTNINLNKKQKTMNLPNIYEIKSKILYLQNKNKKKGKEKLLKKNDLSEYIITNRNNDVKTTVCINNYGINNIHDVKDLSKEGYYNNSEKKHVTEKINAKSGMNTIMSSHNRNIYSKNDSMNNMNGISHNFNNHSHYTFGLRSLNPKYSYIYKNHQNLRKIKNKNI